MKPAHRDLDPVITHPVDETVLLRDPAGPPSCPLVPQWLRLPDPRVLVPGDIFDELVNSLEDLAVLDLPVEVIVPAVIGEGDLHTASSSASTTSCTWPRPSFNWSMERDIRRRFA